MKSEPHLFIIWKNARDKQSEILSEIDKNLRIVEVSEVQWSDEYFSSNMTRFYGQKLPDRSFKEKHCGKGPFLLVICEDLDPKYRDRDTISRSVESVNINLFDMKQKFRGMTGGGHKIHATNNPIETNHDLTLLLGVNIEDYNISRKPNWDNKISKLQRDLSGSNGWKSAEEMFYVMNACEEYVVLRNFECLPEELTISGHDDVDFLVRNYDNFVFLINGRKVFNIKYRVHFELDVGDQRILCDIRSVGDDYYQGKWQEEILKTRMKHKCFYIPNEKQHKFSVLYHAIIHKKIIAEDYKSRLKSWFKTDDIGFLESNLQEFMISEDFIFVEPKDLSVFYNYQNMSFRRITFNLWLGFKLRLRRALNV